MMRKRVASLLIAGAATMLAVTSVGATATTPKATGGVSLSGPTQYLSFSAFDSNPAKGSVGYTNFQSLYPGSGVWSIDGTYALNFQVVGDSTVYTHSMTVPMSAIMPKSNSSFVFSGTGVYPPPPDPALNTWSVQGWFGGTTLSGVNVAMQIVYLPGSADAGYMVTLFGTLNTSTGAMSGTALDSNGLTLDWWTAPAAAHEVLNYTLPVQWADVCSGQHVASFGYTIPANFFAPSTAAIPIAMSVADNGTPGTAGDLVSLAASGPVPCGTVLTNYPITGGNLVVH